MSTSTIEAAVPAADPNPWLNLPSPAEQLAATKAELAAVKKQLQDAEILTPEQLKEQIAVQTHRVQSEASKKLEGRANEITQNRWYAEESKLEDLRISEGAKKRLEAEKSTSGYQALDIADLATLLLEDDAPLEWRIHGMMQVGHNVTLAARYKVGKTTLIANLLKSLADGTNFLSEFPVKQVTKPIVVFNHELSDRQFTAWLRKAGIRNSHMIIPVNLRGMGLYLQDEAAQEWAIELLKKYDAEVWIIDPLQAALRGTVNDDTVASDWIAAADRVKAEAGVSELLLVTHTGHLSKADEFGRSSNERSAGSARWAGWPDALWTYTMDEAGIRYISAEGRDISIEERGLTYEEDSIRLMSKGDDSGRVSAKENQPFALVKNFFMDNPTGTFTRTDVEQAVRKNNRMITSGIRDCISSMVIEEVELPREPGKRGAAPKGYKLRPIALTLFSKN